MASDTTTFKEVLERGFKKFYSEYPKVRIEPDEYRRHTFGILYHSPIATLLSDVVLHTKDGTKRCAFRALLAANSSYFRKLFLSMPNRTERQEISVAVSDSTLFEVLMHAYTGHSNLLRIVLSHVDEISKHELNEVFQLRKAAQMYGIHSLYAWCDSVLHHICYVNPKAACNILQMMIDNGERQGVSKSHVLRYIQVHHKHALRVCESHSKRFCDREIHFVGCQSNVHYHRCSNWGIHVLEPETLLLVLKGITPPPIPRHNRCLTTSSIEAQEAHERHHQTLFSAIFFWITHGCLLPLDMDKIRVQISASKATPVKDSCYCQVEDSGTNNSRCITDNELSDEEDEFEQQRTFYVDKDRSEWGKRLVATLDPNGFSSSFKKTVVVPSGLIDKSAV